MLRVVIGEALALQGLREATARMESVVELQTNLDDVSPEVVAHAAQLLRDAGALDVWTSSGQGKKGSPLMLLHVLAAADREEELATLVFAETGTLGIRRLAVSRRVAERGHVVVSVGGRPVAVKWGRWDGRITSVAPEYEQAAAAAAATGMALREVMDAARAAARVFWRTAVSEEAGRKPEWLKKRLPDAGALQRMETLLRQRHLHTVCESALCPNLGECFGAGVATFLIMGDVCTRDCGFCGVTSDRPGPLDPEEPAQLADATARLQLRHVVVTSVTRDDLPDGGAAHYVATIRSIRGGPPV